MLIHIWVLWPLLHSEGNTKHWSWGFIANSCLGSGVSGQPELEWIPHRAEYHPSPDTALQRAYFPGACLSLGYNPYKLGDTTPKPQTSVGVSSSIWVPCTVPSMCRCAVYMARACINQFPMSVNAAALGQGQIDTESLLTFVNLVTHSFATRALPSCTPTCVALHPFFPWAPAWISASLPQSLK